MICTSLVFCATVGFDELLNVALNTITLYSYAPLFYDKMMEFDNKISITLEKYA